ncbi:DinB family protein [Pseudonocardia yuanmonensis]|uniref:DinB family protein n=1 Tax=Pseudonocardia yuanmonensis TaxID=1095914 RepID=A0ABP8XF64_9PSEU
MTTTGTIPATTPSTPTPTGEKADLLGALAKHRFLFRYTVQGLTDEQAAATPTASELCLGGLIKHVMYGERNWITFVLEGPSAMEFTEESFVEHANSFRMLPGETLEGLLAEYEQIAARTEEVVSALTSLDLSHPLPEAPWFTEDAWSARRVLTHIIAETAQHAGHADILRETIDGQKSMG